MTQFLLPSWLFFQTHKDASYIRENGERSFITMLFYLNEGYKGGKTTFYKPNGKDVNLEVIPKTGMILLHDHIIDHDPTSNPNTQTTVSPFPHLS